MTGHDSALYWFPRIVGAGVRDGIDTPRTEFATLPRGAVMASVGEGSALGLLRLNQAIARTHDAANRVGYPVFLKTDLSSQKHRGLSHIRANSLADVERIVPCLLEDNLCKDIFPEAIMVREWLEVRADFSAFGGLPIGHEWRVFATKDAVLCEHPYWPEDALRFHKKRIGKKLVSQEPKGWRRSLAEAHRDRLPDWCLQKARVAAEACPAAKAWSIDFALMAKTSMRWFLIDMADARHSEHLRAWPDCKVPGENPEAFDDDRTGLNP